MIIGIDFDNTLVCYDELFHQVALEFEAIPQNLPKNKTTIRDYLRSQNREELWTEMQGIVYGKRILEASPYPGAVEFIQKAHESGHQIKVISHKTKHPFIGEPIDLHEAAKRWLKKQRIPEIIESKENDASFFFELTKELKIEQINQQKCDCFIDDLPEILNHPQFPLRTKKICFDPSRQYSVSMGIQFIQEWKELIGF